MSNIFNVLRIVFVLSNSAKQSFCSGPQMLTMCLFKPRTWNHILAKIVSKLHLSGLTVVGLRVVTLDRGNAASLLPAESVTEKEFCIEKLDFPYTNVSLDTDLCAGPLILEGQCGVPMLWFLIGSLPRGGECCEGAPGRAGSRRLNPADNLFWHSSFIQCHVW